MIGFKLQAHGSNGFKQTRGGWTEGSMMALKALAEFESLANKLPFGLTQVGALSSVEASFKKIADAKFANICSFGLSFNLFVEGDITFSYRFDPVKKPAQIQRELLNAMASREERMGNQVMISFCTIIEDFVIMNFNANEQGLSLTINIDL